MQGEPAHETKPTTASDPASAENGDPCPAARNAGHPALIAIARLLARQAAQEWMLREAGSDLQHAFRT